MQKRYNERDATHYESMPRELIEMCLECKTLSCSGNCQRYTERERALNADSSMSRNGKRRKGLPAARYPFRGDRITVEEAAELLGVHQSTVRRGLKQGMNMEGIYQLYAHKNGS